MKNWDSFSWGVARLWALAAACAALMQGMTLWLEAGIWRMPGNLGNWDRTRAMLPAGPSEEPFFFAVAGDASGHATFEGLFGRLKRERLAFLALLGDCARNGSEGDHRFLQRLWWRRRPPFPVFYAVGNHDVDPQRFPVTRFEEVYGPTNFTFEYRGCLFVVLRALPLPRYSTEGTIAFLKALADKGRAGYRRVFVFMHVPPDVSGEWKARPLENGARLAELFEKLGVDYVFTGDYHGLARANVRGVNYVVTGGGGSRLKAASYGRFHHAVVVGVGPDWVSERVIAGEARSDWTLAAVELWMARVEPWLGRGGVWVVAAVAAAGAGAWAVGRRARRVRRVGQV
ncbi:MAG TPA: metallophosphoesterase [Candidatus Brocadiia bacterium]|nr:metallophosphoesterase [Candidatus Brocadiia bacterium]